MTILAVISAFAVPLIIHDLFEVTALRQRARDRRLGVDERRHIHRTPMWALDDSKTSRLESEAWEFVTSLHAEQAQDRAALRRQGLLPEHELVRRAQELTN